MLSNLLPDRHLAAQVGAVFVVSVSCGADIDLRLDTSETCIDVGEVLVAELRAASATDDPEYSPGMDVLVSWDPAVLQFDGIDSSDATPLLISQIPVPDLFGINEADPPADGDLYYQAATGLGEPFEASPDGTLIVRFQFTAIAPAAGTPLDFLITFGEPPVMATRVFATFPPNTVITGDLLGSTIEVEADCPGDANGDQTVDVDDLVAVILAFGSDECPPDVDDSGVVDVDDLIAVVLNFGMSCGT